MVIENDVENFNEVEVEIGDNAKVSKTFDLSDISRYAKLNRITTRVLNDNQLKNDPIFYRYTKDDISRYLSNPGKYEQELRDASVYMYGASPHYYRIIKYFAGLSDLSYIVSPYKVNLDELMESRKIDKFKKNYNKTLDFISSMDITVQLRKMLLVALRDGIGFYTTWRTADNIVFQQLPSKYCKIETVEGGVPNVSFNFSYFSRKEGMLDYYPPEFRDKYENIYKRNTTSKWIELSSPDSFAITANPDIIDYSIPPLSGIFREIYDLEDYKSLKLARTELENYALLAMKLGVDKDGHWALDFNTAVDFWKNLEGVLPDEVGSVLTPMDIDMFNFDKSGTANDDEIANTENLIWSAAGVSSQIFENEKATAEALLISIKSDQAITFTVVKSIEAALNRYLQSFAFGKQFKIQFLDVSPYNRKEFADLCKDGVTLGAPFVSMYCAALGIDQAEMNNMCTLEQDILDVHSRFKPLMSSYTQSSVVSETTTNVDKEEEEA